MALAAKLRIKFGEDPNLEKWQLFLAAYRILTSLNDKLKDASQEAKLWKEDKEFRARMLMQQLRGKPLIWLSQDEYTDVLKDDAQVITALEERYGHTEARVSYINQFEEAIQRSREQTRSYMCRLQQLASIAFPKLKDEDKRERVLSKFVRSVHNNCLREELQLTELVVEDDKIRSYEAVVQEAVRLESHFGRRQRPQRERVKVRHVQSIAKTMQELNTEVSALQEQVAALRSRREYPQRSMERHVGGRRFRHLQCWLCGSHNHGGGCRECPTRSREAPQWKPKVPQKTNHSLRKDFW